MYLSSVTTSTDAEGLRRSSSGALKCYLHKIFHIHNVVYFKNSAYGNIIHVNINSYYFILSISIEMESRLCFLLICELYIKLNES